MEEATKIKVLALYEQFKSHILHSPLSSGTTDIIRAQTIEVVNASIKELIELTGDSEFEKFKLIPLGEDYGPHGIIMAIDYRQMIGGLVGRIHAIYFSDKDEPFATSPSTIITQEQRQEQTTNISIALEIQGKIDGLLPKVKESTPEHTFLQKMREKLTTLKGGIDVLRLALDVGITCGLTIQQIKAIFGW